MDRPNSTERSNCPVCGESLRESWKMCPACETPLTSLLCPQCAQPVKENWRRCPECATRLLCEACLRRIPPGHAGCPVCEPRFADTSTAQPVRAEPITGMEFVYVPAGSFMMGDTFDEGIANERPVHAVRMAAFYIGKYPVTQAQWGRLMSDNPSKFKGDSHPVEQVAWDDVQAFIVKLTQANQEKYEFRLPSEAEWEYAARSGGKKERYAGGDEAHPVAWFEENSGSTTHPVGTKIPNGLGLFDMSGNVWEWCRDTFRADAYEFHPQADPVCSGNGPDRVIRGGGWNLDAWSARCARRFSYPADFFGSALGFRLVMVC
ncbi:MAG: SUMF1/EgtB/PvdO family nonheme iron enzyme [Desulfobacterales bacterium]|nr:MAG: SUMF1/EgtB/PvdO family nonheme iron enzyme [Desulfobacterales bacterium]